LARCRTLKTAAIWKLQKPFERGKNCKNVDATNYQMPFKSFSLAMHKIILSGSRRGHRGGCIPPTRPKEVLTWHLVSLKIIAKNIFVLHIT